MSKQIKMNSILEKVVRRPIHINNAKTDNDKIKPVLDQFPSLNNSIWEDWLLVQTNIDNIYKYQGRKMWKKQLKTKLICFIKDKFLISWRSVMNGWGPEKLHKHFYDMCKVNNNISNR